MVLLSQVTGLVLISCIVAARAEPFFSSGDAAAAAASGLCGAVGLAAFYRGLAVGAMSVVAPISATAAVIPVSVGVATGERPSALQGVGVAIALGGVALASRESADRAGSGGPVAAGVGLALLAAVGFGLFFVGMDAASDDDVFWAIFVNRVTSVALLATAAAATRPRLGVGRGDAGTLMAIGVLDILANTLFAIASTEGLVSLVAVLGSLYPVTTVLLARLVLHERVARAQQAGVAGALAGVVLIGAG